MGSLPFWKALMIPYICNFLLTSASLSLGFIGLLTVGPGVAMAAVVAVTRRRAASEVDNGERTAGMRDTSLWYHARGVWQWVERCPTYEEGRGEESLRGGKFGS